MDCDICPADGLISDAAKYVEIKSLSVVSRQHKKNLNIRQSLNLCRKYIVLSCILHQCLHPRSWKIWEGGSDVCFKPLTIFLIYQWIPRRLLLWNTLYAGSAEFDKEEMNPTWAQKRKCYTKPYDFNKYQMASGNHGNGGCWDLSFCSEKVTVQSEGRDHIHWPTMMPPGRLSISIACGWIPLLYPASAIIWLALW